MYRVILSTIVIIFMAVAAHAGQGDWQVAKASQQVSFTVDRKTWQPVKAGGVIPNQAWVATGPKGRAQLVRGVESITFQPNTLVGLFTTSGLFERKTEIVQRNGTIDLEIEKRSRPHTTVQTPFLAAVVKGTNFRVSVTNRVADVSVNRGLVQVTSFRTGQRSEVGAGQRASVDTKNGMTVAGDVSTPSVTSVSPSTAKVKAVGAKELVSAPVEASSSASRNSSSTTSGNPAPGEGRSGDSTSRFSDRRDGASNGNGWNTNDHSGNGGHGNGNGNSGNGGGWNGNGNNGQGNGSLGGEGNSGNGNANSGNGGSSSGQGNDGQNSSNSGDGGESNSGNGNASSGDGGGSSGQGNDGQDSGNSGQGGEGNSGNGNANSGNGGGSSGQGNNGQGNGNGGQGGKGNGNSGNGGGWGGGWNGGGWGGHSHGNGNSGNGGGWNGGGWNGNGNRGNGQGRG